MLPSRPTATPKALPEIGRFVTAPSGVIRERNWSEVYQRFPSGPATIRQAGTVIGNSVTRPSGVTRPISPDDSVNHIPPGPGVMKSGLPPEGMENSSMICAEEDAAAANEAQPARTTKTSRENPRSLFILPPPPEFCGPDRVRTDGLGNHTPRPRSTDWPSGQPFPGGCCYSGPMRTAVSGGRQPSVG